MVKIILKGNPISNNQLYKRGRGNSFYMTKEAKVLKESYQWQIKQQYKDKLIKDNLIIDIKLFFGNKRKHDWDNYHKIAMDAMNKLVWIDDSQIIKASVQKCFDKDNPRIEITI